ncbi:MAG: hypothetical protein ACREO5_15120, partial [Candidatus Binatia bacterium]
MRQTQPDARMPIIAQSFAIVRYPYTFDGSFSCKDPGRTLMPIYEYICDKCGSFNENRPIAEYAEPCA